MQKGRHVQPDFRGKNTIKIQFDSNTYSAFSSSKTHNCDGIILIIHARRHAHSCACVFGPQLTEWFQTVRAVWCLLIFPYGFANVRLIKEVKHLDS